MARIRKKALIVLAVILVMCVVPCFAKRREKTMTNGGFTGTAIWDDKYNEEYRVMGGLTNMVDVGETDRILSNIRSNEIFKVEERRVNTYFRRNRKGEFINVQLDRYKTNICVVTVMGGDNTLLYNQGWFDYDSAKADFNRLCDSYEKII